MGNHSRSIKENLPLVKCICPNCDCEHKVRLKWIGGKVTPRIYCELCKSQVKKFSSGLIIHKINKVIE